MKNVELHLHVPIGVFALLVACSQPSDIPRFQNVPALGAVRYEGAGQMRYRVLYNFGAGADASRPTYLIAVGDVFYGTTESRRYAAGRGLR